MLNDDRDLSSSIWQKSSSARDGDKEYQPNTGRTIKSTWHKIALLGKNN